MRGWRSLREDSIMPPQRQPYQVGPLRNEQKTLLQKYIFFYVGNFLKVLIEFVTMLTSLCVFGFWPLGKWDLGSPWWLRVNNSPARQETWLGSWVGRPLGRMATHSRIFAWGIPWTEFTVHGV